MASDTISSSLYADQRLLAQLAEEAVQKLGGDSASVLTMLLEVAARLQQDANRTYTVPEVMERWHCSETVVLGHIADSTLPAFKAGRAWVITGEALRIAETTLASRVPHQVTNNN